jgi:hypothetical protein
MYGKSDKIWVLYQKVSYLTENYAELKCFVDNAVSEIEDNFMLQLRTQCRNFTQGQNTL